MSAVYLPRDVGDDDGGHDAAGGRTHGAGASRPSRGRRGDGVRAYSRVRRQATWPSGSAVGLVPLLAYAALARASEDAAHVALAAGDRRRDPDRRRRVSVHRAGKACASSDARVPFAFIVGARLRRRHSAAQLRAGAASTARICVGCCFALFSVLLVVGLMNLAVDGRAIRAHCAWSSATGSTASCSRKSRESRSRRSALIVIAQSAWLALIAQ